MNIDQERDLLDLIRMVRKAWMIIGIVCLVTGALTDGSWWWTAPMGVVILLVAVESWQGMRVRRLEREQS